MVDKDIVWPDALRKQNSCEIMNSCSAIKH